MIYNRNPVAFGLMILEPKTMEKKKLKIYLDTSVISHLSASDAPEKMIDTVKLWEDVVNDVYDILISDIAM